MSGKTVDGAAKTGVEMEEGSVECMSNNNSSSLLSIMIHIRNL